MLQKTKQPLFDPWTHVFNVGSPFDVFCMFNFGLKQDTLPPEDCC